MSLDSFGSVSLTLPRKGSGWGCGDHEGCSSAHKMVSGCHLSAGDGGRSF